MGETPSRPPVGLYRLLRETRPVERLDTSDPATFERWCGTPAHDTRTLEEFADEGGFPIFPPNRNERSGARMGPPR